MVDSPCNEDSKNICFQGGTAGQLRENGQYQGRLLLYKSWVVNFEREYQSLPAGIKVLVVPQFFYMPDQILGQKMRKINCQATI